MSSEPQQPGSAPAPLPNPVEGASVPAAEPTNPAPPPSSATTPPLTAGGPAAGSAQAAAEPLPQPIVDSTTPAGPASGNTAETASRKIAPEASKDQPAGSPKGPSRQPTNRIEIKKAGQFVLNYGSREEEEAQRQAPSLFDASNPWAVAPLREIPLEPRQVSDWLADLHRQRILVLISYDSALLISAAWQIKERFEIRNLPARLLKVHLGCEPGGTAAVDLSVRQEPKEPALIVAGATAEPSASLAYIVGDIETIERTRLSLCDSGHLLLILTNDRTLGWVENRTGIEDQREGIYARVDFISTRLRQACENWEELAAELLRQRKAGFWDQDEASFCNRFIRDLDHGRLIGEIEKRRQERTPAAGDQASAGRLLSPRTPLENTVLFVATFFPNVPMRDFERLVLLLLGDRCQETKTAMLVLSPDGEGRAEEVAEKRLLHEIWRETYPEVLQRCQLQAQSVEAGLESGAARTIVDFTSPELRDDLRGAFFGAHAPIFLLLFRQLRAAPQLFAESTEVVSAAVRLLVDTALASPGEFAGPGLGGLLPLASASPPPPAAPEAAAATDSAAVPDVKPALLRFHPCLRAFLQQPQLRGLVTRFFQELLLAGRGHELVELAWALRGAADWQALPWCKRLLDESGGEAKRRATSKVKAKLRWGIRSGAAAGEVLRGVFGWLPPSLGAGAERGAATFASGFFVGLCEELLFGVRRRSRSAALANPLLSAACIEGEDLEKLLVAWLFHPAAVLISQEQVDDHFGWWIGSWLVPAQLRQQVFTDQPTGGLLATLGSRWEKIGYDQASTSQTLIELLFPALVLADWAVDLLCQEPSPAASAAVYERLLTALAARCDARRRITLSILWSGVEESLLDLLAFLDGLRQYPDDLDAQSMKVIRTDQQSRRRCVRRLRLDLQSRGRAAVKPH